METFYSSWTNFRKEPNSTDTNLDTSDIGIIIFDFAKEINEGWVRQSKIDYVFSVTRARDKFHTALLNFISENARCYFFSSQWPKKKF